jgi:hypothetical protein
MLTDRGCATLHPPDIKFFQNGVTCRTIKRAQAMTNRITIKKNNITRQEILNQVGSDDLKGQNDKARQGYYKKNWRTG